MLNSRRSSYLGHACNSQEGEYLVCQEIAMDRRYSEAYFRVFRFRGKQITIDVAAPSFTITIHTVPEEYDLIE